MRKKEIIELLQSMDDAATEQIAKEHPALSAEDRERLYQKIQQNLRPDAAPKEAPEAEQMQVIQASRFGWMRHAAAAACLLVMAGTVTGLAVLQSRIPAPEQIETTESISMTQAISHAPGERYAVPNLTVDGTLWMTVTDARREGDLWHVTLTLESEGAVFSGRPEQLMADNFLAAMQTPDGVQTISPCRAEVSAGNAGEMPNTVLLPQDTACTLELWYTISDAPYAWMLVTGTGTETPYTEIRSEVTT